MWFADTDLLHQDLTLSTSSLNAELVGGFAPDMTENHSISTRPSAQPLFVNLSFVCTPSKLHHQAIHRQVSYGLAPTLQQFTDGKCSYVSRECMLCINVNINAKDRPFT